MSRRKLKRVDYSKFSTSGPSSDSEDDFQESPSPKRKTDNKTVKKSERKKTAIKDISDSKSKKGEEDDDVSSMKRSTRTSNADVVYEQDLMTAIEISRSSETSPKDDIKKTEVIDLTDSEDEENVIKLLKKRKSHTKEEDSFEDSTPDNSNPAFADTIPVVRESVNESSQHSPLKEITVNINKNKNTPTIMKTSINSKTVASVGISNGNIALNRTPSLRCNKPSLCNTINKTVTPTLPSNKTPVQSLVSNKTETPGRLRLGLSRNIRVAKPLHSNVKAT